MIAAPLPWVVKVGGRELAPGPELGRLAERLASAVRAGVPTVLVHGGGDEISARAEALGLPVQRVDGQRVTDPAMLEVVIEVLAGRVNARLVDALGRSGVAAVGLSGLSDRLLTVRPVPALGFVGEPSKVRPRALERLLAAGLTPVVAPIGAGPSGGAYNVNADLAAGAIAAALSAELAILTDVPAVRDADGAPIPELRPSEIPRLLRDGTARDGMIPKLRAAAAAVAGGAPAVWIGTLAALTPPGGPRPVGTVVRGRTRAPPSELSRPRAEAGGTR